MPLVTLREGMQPLLFPTDLSVDKQLVIAGSKSAGAGAGAATAAATTSSSSTDAADQETPTNCISLKIEPGATSTPRNSSEKQHKIYPGGGKLKHLSKEEATALMLKAVAEKQAAATGLSSSVDMSYGEETLGTSSGVGASGNGNNSSDYPATLSGAVAFADVGGPAGLSHINILSTISAMNNLISGSSPGGGTSSCGGSSSNTGGGNAGSGSTGNLTVTLVPGGGSGAGNNNDSTGGAGHPCPVCGRVYKLKSSLRNHQKWECGKEPQFQCPFCVYRAKQKMHIGRHMERMHKEKFKLEDDKSFISSLAGIPGGVAGVAGGVDADAGSTSAAVAAAAAAAALASVPELHTHFS
ncbi:hypothetical protein KR222_009870 [Zaprionus bogoriensis]|nr:hypothetical protein KR222_009870 [Zaprionus bogoriensis]